MNTVLFYIFIEFSNILVFTIVCNKIRPRLMNVLNLGIISLCWSLDVMNPFLSNKNLRKIQLKSKLSLGLIYGLAFGFKQHLIFQRAEFKKLVLYSQGHNCYLILKLLKANFWFAFKFATCEHGVKLLVKFAFIIFDLAYLKGI